MDKQEVKAPAPVPGPKKPKDKVYEPETLKKVKALIEMGIPVKFALFRRTVRSNVGTPESAFYARETDPKLPNPQPSRIAEMWYTPHGLVTLQAGGIYKVIPLANLVDTIVL
jgi:hypothetical protein